MATDIYLKEYQLMTYPDCFRLFLSFLLLQGIVVSQPNTPTLERINRSRLLYYEAIEQGASGYWEQAILKLEEAEIINSQDRRIPLIKKILYDILDGNLDEDKGVGLFKHVVDLTFQEGKSKIRFMDKTIADYPDYAIFYLYRGIIQEYLQDSSQALTDYTTALKKDSNLYYGYYLRGRIHASKQNFVLALNDFNQAIHFAPDWYAPYYERGKLFQILDKLDDSIADYEKAYQLYPLLDKMLIESLKICEGYNNRGLNRLEQKEYQKAIVDFNTAIEWNSIFYEPYMNRGIVFRNMGLYQSAIADFNQVIGLDSTNLKGYLNRALTFERIGDDEKAEQDLLYTITLNPNTKQAYQNLGEIYYRQRQFDKAINAFENLLFADSTDYWGYYWIALSYDAKRRYPEAIKAYERFIHIAPEEYYEHKVKMYERAERLKDWLEKKRRQ